MPVDTYSRVKFTNGISPVSPAATGTITGKVLDTSGYRSNTFVIHAGLQSASVTSVTPVVLSGTATSSLGSCAAAELIGTEAAAASGLAGALTTGTTEKIGYIGTDRYVRCDLTVAGAATGVYAVQLVQADAIEPQ